MSMLNLIFLLRLSLITACCTGFSQVYPINGLKIEAYRIKNTKSDDLVESYIFEEGNTNLGILMELYETVENENLTGAKRCDPSNYFDIFFKNSNFEYTPAEWAILNDKLEILRLFVDNCLLEFGNEKFINQAFKTILSACIRFGKLEAFKLLWNLVPDVAMIKSEASLNLAAQHFVSQEFWNYLFDEGVGFNCVAESSISKCCESVVMVAIKFNNILAAKIIIERFGITISADAIKMIMIRNRRRLLESIISSEVCDVIGDESGLGLIHHAAKYSNDPNMISMIFEKCPNAKLENEKFSDQTPFDLYLNSDHANIATIAKVFIFNGSDIFFSNNNRKSALETIIKRKLRDVFAFILGEYDSHAHFDEFLKLCIENESWALLDEILVKRPKFIDSLNIDKVSFRSFSNEDAPIFFRFCLETGLISYDDDNFIEWLVMNDSAEFIKIVLDSNSNDQGFHDKFIEFDKLFTSCKASAIEFDDESSES